MFVVLSHAVSACRELGIELRLQHLMNSASTGKQKDDMMAAYDRLIGTEDGQMGEHFKVLCISQVCEACVVFGVLPCTSELRLLMPTPPQPG